MKFIKILEQIDSEKIEPASIAFKADFAGKLDSYKAPKIYVQVVRATGGLSSLLKKEIRIRGINNFSNNLNNLLKSTSYEINDPQEIINWGYKVMKLLKKYHEKFIAIKPKQADSFLLLKSTPTNPKSLNVVPPSQYSGEMIKAIENMGGERRSKTPITYKGEKEKEERNL